MNRLLPLSLLALVACEDTAERADRQAVARQQSQYVTAQPIPTFDWSLERDVAIQLYEARNERVTTHTVWRSDTGVVEGDCPSIGYPLPYDTSLTNPLKRAYHNSAGIIEQAEPNGLFSSKNSISTWVRCIVKSGGKTVEAPIYIESKVTAYPFPVEVDYDANRVRPVADVTPTVVIQRKKKPTTPAPTP